MKHLLLTAFALLSLNAIAQDIDIIVETPVFDGVVIVAGAPTPAPVVTPVIYDQPVVYTAPVQYNAPVVYNGPVIYNNTTVTASSPVACPDELNGMTVTIYPRRNCSSRCSNVTIVGRGSALIR